MYVWVMSCMARCCVLLDLSWSAFCTVQSSQEEFVLLKETEVHLSQGVHLCQSMEEEEWLGLLMV